jgi:stage II sporulation SpoE-like protein
MARPARSRGAIRPRPVSLVVTAIIAAITAALAVLTHITSEHTEARLLRLKVAEAGAVLQTAVPTVQTPLSAAAEFATGPAADAVPAFRRYIVGYIGPQPKTFVSASLWSYSSGGVMKLLTTVGEAPRTRPGTASTNAFFARAAAAPGLALTGVLAGSPPHLGYAYTMGRPRAAYAVYVESALPETGHVRTPPGTAFSDLLFRMYLGAEDSPSALLEENTDRLTGDTARVTVPFGDSALLLVAGADGPLAGQVAASLWWIVALTGGVLALLAGAVTERLVRRRRAAESLTDAVQTLLDREHSVAMQLARAVVPDVPDAIPGVDLEARYLTGAGDVEVGGDWYDAIDIGERRVFLVVGDVCGRGIEASTAMASLRAAVRAFVSEGHPPGDVLVRLNRLLGISAHGRFATVLCALLDEDRQQITVACAGHLPPLVIGTDGAQYLRVSPGPPIGVAPSPEYPERRHPLHAGDVVVLFTDGVVERRNESIETGLQRLADVAAAAPRSLGPLLDALVRHRTGGTDGTDGTDPSVVGDAVNDDSALLAVRWNRSGHASGRIPEPIE